jgi:hypothetical protein
MSGGSGGGQPQSPMGKYGMTKEGQDDASLNTPVTSVPPGGPGSDPTRPRPQGSGFNIQGPGNFLGTPFNQTYGGQGAPYADLGAQILDSFRQYQSGAGRFSGNNVPRYGFAQQMPNFRTQSVGPGPAPGGPPPGAPGAPPVTAAPPGQPPAAGGATDHWANFSALMKEDPTGFAAMEYGNRANTGNANFRQANQFRIMNEFFGGDQARYNQWVNDNQAGGVNWNNGGGNALQTVNAPVYNRIMSMLGNNSAYNAGMAGPQGAVPAGAQFIKAATPKNGLLK